MNKRSKTKLAVVNFFPLPRIKEANYKITRYYQSFDFLYLLTSDFDVQIFDRIGKTVSFNHEHIRFNYFRSFFASKLVIPFKQIRAIREWNPDIIYIDGLGYPHFILLLKQVLKPATRIVVRDHADKLPRNFLKPLFRVADTYVESYLFTAKAMGKAWIDAKLISSEDKIIECIEGSTKFGYSEDIEKIPHRFLWVGRLDKNKDPLTIVTAFSVYVKIEKTASLKMIFDTDNLLDTVKAIIKKEQLINHVELIGKVPHSSIENYFKESTFFMLGSYKEGGPFSLIEAMACGCIPIVTNIPAFKAMLDNGRVGFMFTPGNVEELKHILSNLRNQNLERCRHDVLARFDTQLSNKAIANTLLKL